MKSGQLLYQHLNALVSSLGHMDEIVISDSGLPVPEDARVIDLAVSPRIPSVLDVLMALRFERVMKALSMHEKLRLNCKNKSVILQFLAASSTVRIRSSTS